MMACDVLGIGWVTASGYGQSANAQDFSLVEGPLPRLDQRTLFGSGMPRFGRLDAYTRLGLAAFALALKDANLDVWEEKRPMGLVSSSETGCLETDEQYFRTVIQDEGRFASPNLFAYTLPNGMLGEASIHFGLTGPAFVVNEANNDTLAGVRTGMGMLSVGLCGTVVAGVCNATPATLGMTFANPPGAVFFVMEQRANGKLDIRNGALCWSGVPVLSLESLVSAVCETGPQS